MTGAFLVEPTAFRQGPGTLLVSGTDIARDLGSAGNAQGQAFFGNVLRAGFVSADAAQTQIQCLAGSLFQSLAFPLDTGSGDAWPVQAPDGLSAVGSLVGLTYGTGTPAAAVYLIQGASAVFTLGFPFEPSIRRRSVRP